MRRVSIQIYVYVYIVYTTYVYVLRRYLVNTNNTAETAAERFFQKWARVRRGATTYRLIFFVAATVMKKFFTVTETIYP